MANDVLAAMYEDMKRDEEVLQAKRKILKIIKSLTDDEMRRRVIAGAVATVLAEPEAETTP